MAKVTQFFGKVKRFGGAFLNGIIQPGRTIREALQDLETYVFNLPSALTPKGTWDADADNPPLSLGGSNVGDYYIVSVAGTTTLSGISSWAVGDQLFLGNDGNWYKVDNTEIVTSVFGRLGAVVATAGDYIANQITYTPSLPFVSTNVQAAIGEVSTRVVNLNTLSGVAANAIHLGTFTGSIIPDNSDIKEALQELETAVGGLGTVSYLIPITYAQLDTAISGSTLIPGQKYLLSDYQTVHTIYLTSDTNTGPVEPLILTALTVNSISEIAYSQSYPSDVIIYNRTNTAEMPGATKGFIRRRIDLKKNIDVCFDFRAVKFRAWQVTQAAYSNLTEYRLNEVVVDSTNSQGFGSDVLFISMAEGNIGNSLSDGTKWLQLTGYFKNNGYWGLVNNSTFNLNGTAPLRPATITTSSLYQDFFVIGDLSVSRNVFIERPNDFLTSIFTNRNGFSLYAMGDVVIGRYAIFSNVRVGTITSSSNISLINAVCSTINCVNNSYVSRSWISTFQNCNINVDKSIFTQNLDSVDSMQNGYTAYVQISNITTAGIHYCTFFAYGGLNFVSNFGFPGTAYLRNNYFKHIVTANLTSALWTSATDVEVYRNNNGDVKIQYRDASDALITAAI